MNLELLKLCIRKLLSYMSVLDVGRFRFPLMEPISLMEGGRCIVKSNIKKNVYEISGRKINTYHLKKGERILLRLPFNSKISRPKTSTNALYDVNLYWNEQEYNLVLPFNLRYISGRNHIVGMVLYDTVLAVVEGKIDADSSRAHLAGVGSFPENFVCGFSVQYRESRYTYLQHCRDAQAERNLKSIPEYSSSLSLFEGEDLRDIHYLV